MFNAKELATDVATRWSSTYQMLRRFTDNIAAIVELVNDTKIPLAEFFASDGAMPTNLGIELGKAMMIVLRPLETATARCGSEGLATLAAAPRLIFDLSLTLMPKAADIASVCEFKAALFEEFNIKFSPLFEGCNLALMAADISPVYSAELEIFVDGHVLDDVWRALAEEAVLIGKHLRENCNANGEISVKTSSSATSLANAMPKADELTLHAAIDQLETLRNHFRADSFLAALGSDIRSWREQGGACGDFNLHYWKRNEAHAPPLPVWRAL